MVRAAPTLSLLLFLVPPVAAAPPPQEPLVAQVEQAIKKGKDYLIAQQHRDGHWEVEGTRSHPGGRTSLALLALMNAGVKPQDPIIQRGIQWLRGVELTQTYVVSLQTMAYCLAGEDKQRIQKNVDWLLASRRMNNNTFEGWSYGEKATISVPDNSNTQYALLALHEAHLAGVPIDAEVWRSIRDYYIRTQSKKVKGGWPYRNLQEQDIRLTMTTAGLCGLIIAGMDLNTGRETRGERGWLKCGEYVENEAVANALDFLGRRLQTKETLNKQDYLYYYLYGLERAGRLTGMRFFGEHDWYRIGCEYLVENQRGDGSWVGRSIPSQVLATSFALLFLSKGRTPILISKLVHQGSDGRNLYPNDWNNDRNDARHLVDFASRELFKRQPMGWQVFNTQHVESKVDDLVAELLQSPIAYISGHYAPSFEGRMSDREGVLRKYVENGGFIFAEACCGRPEFDEGFRALMQKLFPESPLREIPPSHPIWTASGKFAVVPGKPFRLEGIQWGCRTAVVYSPQDLSCWWESNEHEKGTGQTAFQLGANVIAYATGLVPPAPRLTPMEVLSGEEREREVPRRYLKVAQLWHEGDWQPAPRAMPNLMRELRTKAGLDVALQVEQVRPDRAEVADFKFLYMHGRREFSFPKERLADLRFNLENGAILLADACCGSPGFRDAFPKLIADLWPDGKYKLERIPLKDDLFSEDLTGKPVTRVMCRRDEGGQRDREYRGVDPFLEGVKINGRWAVIYSKYDLGCALEKVKSPDCLGHDYDSAVRLGSAVVLYWLKR